MALQFDSAKLRGKHNRLFRPGDSINLNACVGRNGGPATYERFAWGYFEAGARLVESLRQDPFGVDGLVYPIVLLYRHGIEVSLKHLARVVPLLLDDAPEVKATHRLLDNWAVVRRGLSQLSTWGSELDQVETILKDFVEIDSNGEVFRYPEARDGTPHLPDLRLINVDVFAEQMAWLVNFFETCGYWLDDRLERKHEQMAYEAEMEQDLSHYYET